MDNNSISINGPEEQKSFKRSKRPLYIVILAIAMLVIGAGGYLAGRFLDFPTSREEPKTLSTTPDGWEKLASNKKGFPVPGTDNATLTYYSIEKAKTISLKDIRLRTLGGGSIGVGNTNPIASPDLHYIAYIGEDGNLWLFSNETEQTKQLTSNGLVSSINSWSPDSKKILYHYEQKTISSSTGGIDAPMPRTVDFKPQTEQGFYQTNIETGAVTPLAAIDNAEGYIDNETLLVKISAESSGLVAFSIKDFRADLASIEPTAEFGVGQFNFSSDGKQWAYLYPADKNQPTEGETRIVFGKYPAAATTIIASGRWAAVQRPMFSPDNKKIAYQRADERIGGYPQNRVWVYDIASGSNTEIGDGAPVHWIDEKTIVVRQQDADDRMQSNFAVLDIETKQVTMISK